MKLKTLNSLNQVTGGQNKKKLPYNFQLIFIISSIIIFIIIILYWPCPSRGESSYMCLLPEKLLKLAL